MPYILTAALLPFISESEYGSLPTNYGLISTSQSAQHPSPTVICFPA